MQGFFPRIFLSIWAIMLITTALTVLAANLLRPVTDSAGDDRYENRLVEVVALDLREQLAVSPETAIDTMRERHVLDMEQFMQIFIIDAEGRDIAGRQLPPSVSQLIGEKGWARNNGLEVRDPRLTVHGEVLDGYSVVGYRSLHPFSRALMQPNARVILLSIAILVSASVCLVLTRFIVLPVRRLREAGHKVAEGDLSVRVAHTVGERTDDIAKLAQDFDVMTERVEQLLASQQQLMRDVSHELRSPLARIQAILSISRQKSEHRDMADIDRIEHEVERLNLLIGEILSYARLQSRQQAELSPTDLVELVRAIAEDARIEGQERHIDVRMSGPEPCVVSVDNALIQRAIENVVRNALKYTAEHTLVEIAIGVQQDTITLTVDDRGPGVPEAALTEIFEPFYRVNGVNNHSPAGSGVGLAIAKRSLLLHGGSIRANNREGGGLSVVISLPRGAQQPAEA